MRDQHVQVLFSHWGVVLARNSNRPQKHLCLSQQKASRFSVNVMEASLVTFLRPIVDWRFHAGGLLSNPKIPQDKRGSDHYFGVLPQRVNHFNHQQKYQACSEVDEEYLDLTFELVALLFTQFFVTIFPPGL